MSERWRIEAHFELRDQAKQAADLLRSIQPIFMHIAYSADATGADPMRPYDWEEYTRNYPSKAARL
jgi:hypothetical protein